MATVIYNHREMEYQWKKYWKEEYQNQVSFEQIFTNTGDEQIKTAGCHLVERVGKTEILEDYAMDYGYDTMRLYLMFVGEPKKGQEYEEGSLEGIYKFLNRLMILIHSCATKTEAIAHNEKKELQMLTDQKALEQLAVSDLEFGARMDAFLLEENAHMLVSAFMEQTTKLSNLFHRYEACLPVEVLMHFLQRLAPFAPFMSEALWHELGNQKSVFETAWLVCDKKRLQSIPQKVAVAIQLNGKTKAVMELEMSAEESEVLAKAKEILKDRYPTDVKKIIYVQDKIVNLLF